jgi:hypothetical protein
MKRIRIVGLCLVAMFAMSAVAAASASAESPEYKTCIKKVGGTLNKITCAESKGLKGEGGFAVGEWNQGKTRKFTGKNGVSTLDSYIPENEAEPWTGGTIVGTVVCKNATNKGEVTGPKTGAVTVTFKGCVSEGKKCLSKGQKPGTIVTNPLLTELGNTSEGVGVNVFNAENVSAEFECEGQKVVTHGSVIGIESGNIGKFSKTSVQTFAVNEKGGQQEPFGEFGGKVGLHILVSLLTPPGVELPGGEKTTATLKGENMEIL